MLSGRGIINKLILTYRGFRISEVILMCGFFMIGAAFAMDALTKQELLKLILSFIMVFFFIQSVYSFNAFSGKSYDDQNQRLAKLGSITDRRYIYSSAVFLTLSMVIAIFLNVKIIFFLIVLCLLWIAYSYPVIGFKNKPFTGSLIHFFAQILHFNMIYMIFKPISLESILISVYFALLFTAGHLHHEVIDYESDHQSEVKTGAVFLGLHRSIHLSFAIFSIAALYSCILYIFDMIDGVELIILLSAYVFQVILFLILNQKMKQDYLLRIKYRNIYRIFYALVCIVLVGYKIILIKGTV